MKTKLNYFVKENKWLTRGSFGMDFGWGNGYVCLPKGHPCFGMDYNEIHNAYQIDINGGLTFSCDGNKCDGWTEIPDECRDHWIVGFDTTHSWDNLEMWPKRMVEFEAKKLASQFENLTPKSPDFEVKSVVEKESYDLIYKSGYVECLNHLEKYLSETHWDNKLGFNLNEWIDQQRTTLNKYL